MLQAVHCVVGCESEGENQTWFSIRLSISKSNFHNAGFRISNNFFQNSVCNCCSIHVPEHYTHTRVNIHHPRTPPSPALSPPKRWRGLPPPLGGRGVCFLRSNLIVVKLPGGFSKISVLIFLDFLWFWRSLEVLESSGRPRGRISTWWRPSKLPSCPKNQKSYRLKK